ncbi:MAG TPA: hypothetical protein VGK67_33675 [Myxococcales bacterium]
MKRRAFVSALAALACLASSCDYDAAYRTWCHKNGCQDLPEGDGGIVQRCDGCGAEGDVCVVLDGAAACKKSCTGFISSCSGGLDCKLAVSATKATLVPACLPSGASTSSCSSSPDCVEGYTCDADHGCVEICTPFKTVCSSSTHQCTWGLNAYPADWGYCSLTPGA